MNISYEIERLIQYGFYKGLIKEYDAVYVRNSIADVIGLDSLDGTIVVDEKLESPEPILNNLLDFGISIGKIKADTITQRDLWDTRIMDCLMPRPSEVIDRFYSLYEKDRDSATEYFFNLSKASNYIRTDRIKKDLKWKTKTQYGDLDITINLSKPEKDPRDIARERNMSSNSYPKCLLCRENEGYAGRANHPARQNHRIIPIKLNNEKWYFQYSPYVYYNEHCIVLKSKHEQMKISKETFVRLMDFVEQFSHYFIGSNADLPIVGGSILSHDHFQGGNYSFAMASAEVERQFKVERFKGVNVGRVKWPMSVIRLEGNDKNKIVEAANYIYEKWKDYSDEEVGIVSQSNGIRHNTVTPIARINNGRYQMDVVLRNNRTSKEFPEGIFHPHRDLHHIKKENIGLIEVMGLAVLPARLNSELKRLSSYLLRRDMKDKTNWDNDLLKHRDWYLSILDKYPVINEKNVDEIIKEEVGLKFLRVLEDAGVFKRDLSGQKALDKFIDRL